MKYIWTLPVLLIMVVLMAGSGREGLIVSRRIILAAVGVIAMTMLLVIVAQAR
jgi:hypothetical protein